MTAPTLGMCPSCPPPGINPFLVMILAGAEETLHGAADVTELEALPRDLQAALSVHLSPHPKKLYLNQIQSATCDRFYGDVTLLCEHCSFPPTPARKNFESDPILQRILHTRSESAPKYVGFLFQPHPTAAVETGQDFLSDSANKLRMEKTQWMA